MAIFRCTNSSPGRAAVNTLSGARESAQPSQSTLGACPCAPRAKKPGSSASTSVAHCALEESRRERTGKEVDVVVGAVKGMAGGLAWRWGAAGGGYRGWRGRRRGMRRGCSEGAGRARAGERACGERRRRVEGGRRQPWGSGRKLVEKARRNYSARGERGAI